MSYATRKIQELHEKVDELEEDLQKEAEAVRKAEDSYRGLNASHIELLAACRLALNASDMNRTIDRKILETAIENAGGK